VWIITLGKHNLCKCMDPNIPNNKNSIPLVFS
jgi:hypothetical protein